MEEEIGFQRVQQRGDGGSFQVVIPKREVAKRLGLRPGDRVKVYFDAKNRRWTYEYKAPRK